VRQEFSRRHVPDSLWKSGWVSVEAATVARRWVSVDASGCGNLDVIIPDTQMPGRSGVHLLEDLKRNTPAPVSLF
jgi:hypothetical protein